MSTAAALMPIATGIAPPHSLEAEQAVLGAVLIAPSCFATLRLEDGLAAEHFYRDSHRAIFTAMCDLHGRGDPIDTLTVTAELEGHGQLQAAGGRAVIDDLTAGVPGLSGVRRYAEIVTGHWVARERLSSSYEQQAAILNHAPEEEYQKALARAHAVVAAGVSDGFLGRDVLADHILRWLEEPRREGLPMPAHLPTLARMVRLEPGHVTVLGAFPSGGKTSCLLALATSMGSRGKRVVIWTNEDTAEELVAKHVQMATGIPSSVVSEKRLDDSRMAKVIGELGRLPFEVQPCAGWTAAQIATHIRQVAPDVAGVDHFHNLPGVAQTSDIDEAIRSFAIAAGQTPCHLILCAQLNRARRTGVCKPPPVLGDLRGSGMFEAAAHTILLVHRDEEEIDDVARGKTGKAMQLDSGSIDVAKNKVTGRVGVVSVAFEADRIRFVERDDVGRGDW